MAYKVITICPVCSKKLRAIKLKCSSCSTVIENEFEFSKFDYLSKEHLYFIEVFLKCRGNIKDVEKELGISYPTVRAKLDEVLGSLGYASPIPTAKASNISRNKVLDALESGEIDPEEALNMLKQ